MIEVKYDDRTVMEALQALQHRLADLSGPLREIGEDLLESTKRRFETSTGPDGERWAANSQATFDAYLRQVSGDYDPQTGRRVGDKKGWFLQDGRASSKAAGVVAGKKPLIGESKALSTTITYQVRGNTLVVGSNMPYAAMQQFGGGKGEFPHLWGDIPARPFLGVSDDDRASLLDVLRRHLAQAS